MYIKLVRLAFTPGNELAHQILLIYDVLLLGN